MGRVETHNSLNHERSIRDLVENGQFFAFFEIEKVAEDHQSGRLTLVLAKKEVQGSGFVMRPPEPKGEGISPDESTN
jgi:hypothetical protein